jgi:membrane-associated phospholipid phosphatase
VQAPPSPPSLHPAPLHIRPRVWIDVARIFSTVCNPFLTSLALFVILAGARSHGTNDFWVLLFNSIAFTSLGPMLYIFWCYATGKISDLDMSVRAERQQVFGAFVIFYALGTIDLVLIHAPRFMSAAMAGFTASSLIVQLITRYWKISTHAIGITAPLVALTYLFGREPLPFMVLIPIVGWARVYLRAHTLLQVVAGTALGAVSTVIFFALFHVA